MDSSTAYLPVLELIMAKQIQILGPDICIAKARHVKGLSVDSSGRVVSVDGRGAEVLSSLVGQFADISPVIIKRVVQGVLVSQANGAQISTTEIMHQAHLEGAQVTDSSNPIQSSEVVKSLKDVVAKLH